VGGGVEMKTSFNYDFLCRCFEITPSFYTLHPKSTVMKNIPALLAFVILFSSCATSYRTSGEYGDEGGPPITESLFTDKSASISEENIQKILDGSYKMPQQLRVAIIKLDGPQKRYYWNSWGDEAYLRTQQAFLDSFTAKFKQSPRVAKLMAIPDLLVSKSPQSLTSLRESAVRMQADIVVAYVINSDIYTKYRGFKQPNIKAYATTQLVIMDVRTGLVPFSTIVTRDFLALKKKEELDVVEARNRVQTEAVLLTINEIGNQVAQYLNKE
jgi:hypothetical protein